MHKLIISLFLIFLLAVFIHAETWIVSESYVLDGDTIRVVYENKVYKIRFIGIDSPEKDQAGGLEAKMKLESLTNGKTITVKWTKKDPNGRLLGQVFVDKLDINLEMLTEGYAWVYYLENVPKLVRSKYKLAFNNAEVKGLGIFANKEAIEPSIFRKNKKCGLNL